MDNINNDFNPNTCGNCQKTLQFSNTSPVFNCIQCSKKLCIDCIEDHIKQYPNHNIVRYKNSSNIFNNNDETTNSTNNNPLNDNINNDNKDETQLKETYTKINNNDCFCLICKIQHYKYPSRIYYNCNECKGYICSYCKKTHDFENYSHILINPHKHCDDEQKTKTKNKRSASVGIIDNCDKNYLNKNPNLTKMRKTGSIDLFKTKMKKKNNVENKNKNISFVGSGNAFCFECRKYNSKFEFCGKCMRLFCEECFISHDC